MNDNKPMAVIDKAPRGDFIEIASEY